MVMVTRAAAAAGAANHTTSEANGAAGPEQQRPQGLTHSVTLRSSRVRALLSALKDQLKEWQTWSSCEVLLVAGLTTTQLDAAHKLIAKQHGVALVHETLNTQEDGAKVLRVMKAAKCITAVLLALQTHSCSLPQEVVLQLLQPMRTHWAAIAAAQAEHARAQAEQRRLSRLSCMTCGVKGNVRPLVFDDYLGGLRCQTCLDWSEEDSEDFDEYEDGEFSNAPSEACDCPACMPWLYGEYNGYDGNLHSTDDEAADSGNEDEDGD